MFTHKHISRTKHEFWLTFGRYMSPVPSADGAKVNWINYHTGVKNLFFRMDAGVRSASVFISLESPDQAMQERHFEQLLQSKKVFHEILGEDWIWKLHMTADEKVVSRIHKELPDTSVMNKDQWSDLISFFKPRMIALDLFWDNAKYGFDGMY